MANPNFPENLSISPSQLPQTAPVTAVDPYVSHFAFDASAQAAAIEKYGIAGRVWYSSCHSPDTPPMSDILPA